MFQIDEGEDYEEIKDFDDKHKFITIHRHSKEMPGARAYQLMTNMDEIGSFDGSVGQLG